MHGQQLAQIPCTKKPFQVAVQRTADIQTRQTRCRKHDRITMSVGRCSTVGCWIRGRLCVLTFLINGPHLERESKE